MNYAQQFFLALKSMIDRSDRHAPTRLTSDSVKSSEPRSISKRRAAASMRVSDARLRLWSGWRSSDRGGRAAMVVGK
jgi:hypothetical protein